MTESFPWVLKFATSHLRFDLQLDITFLIHPLLSSPLHCGVVGSGGVTWYALCNNYYLQYSPVRPNFLPLNVATK